MAGGKKERASPAGPKKSVGYHSALAADLFLGKTVVVTGGGSGIGRCISHELASLGARPVLIGRTLAKLENVAAEIREDGGLCDYFACDIRDEERVVEVVKEIFKKYGKIHGLVNNAGGQFPAKLEDISNKGFEAVVKNNLIGGFLMSREVFKQSMRDSGGAIVNISAVCENGFPMMGHTGAARAGTENLTKTAAWEWGAFGVRVNAVAPGFIASSGLDSYDENTKSKLRTFANKVPLKRMATEAEVSAIVCFLLSPAGAYISGVTIPVDGGARFSSSETYFPLSDEPSTNSETFDGFHRAITPEVLS